MEAEPLPQIAELVPALAAGTELTVMVTVCELEQLPGTVSNNVYEVVTDGLTVGFELLEENPEGELVHE